MQSTDFLASILRCGYLDVEFLLAQMAFANLDGQDLIDELACYGTDYHATVNDFI